MALSSSSKSRQVPKSLAFVGLLGLLLIASIVFAPHSNAGLPAFQSTGISAKRHRLEFVPGEVLVRFKPNKAFEGSTYMPVPNEQVQPRIDGIQGAAIQEQIQVQVDRFDGSDLVDGLRIAHAADTAKAIAALGARDDVLYAEPNYLRRVTLMPNDPRYNEMWALKNTGQTVNNVVGTAGADIHAEQAWNITTGNSNIVVGVIDEGIDITHQDLAPNIWTNPAPGSISGISGDLHGYDFINNSGTIPPELHATHVAGTIGAVGNNGVGVVGINWQVSLMSLRFINDATGSGTEANAIRAYNYAKQMRDLWVSSGGTKGANIRALNASYGGGGFTQAESDALNALGQSGVLFVAAAGNESTNTDITPNYPSGYGLPNIISVAATNSNDQRAGFSNYGPQSVLMGAPGVNILSTLPGNNYDFLSGTSMATPHVTGAAALLCAKNPNLTVNQLRALLAFNGDVVNGLQGATLTGRRLNVFNSLQALAQNDTTPPGTVGNFRVVAQNGRTFTLSWIASGDDNAVGRASLYEISFTDQSSGKVTGLTSIAPDTPGTTQSVTVTVPYRHIAGTIKLREFDKVGNEGIPASTIVSIDPPIADPYVPSLNSPASLSTGGTGLGLTFDDRYLENFSLPFNFPFFGQSYNTVTISTNGNLYFSPPPKRPNGDADDVPSSIDGMSQFKMIAGMWDDLDLRTSNRADADVYVVKPNSSTIIFRWQGVPCNDFGSGCTGGDPINFEIELNANGTIKTRYGSGNTNLHPVVGISGGGPDAYVIDALTSELSPKTLTNAQSAVFTPRALASIPTVQFSSAFYSVGEGDGRVNITVTRSGDMSGAASVNFATIDDAGLQDCAIKNGIASPRCDYESVFGTLTWAAGDASPKTFSVAIVDDSYAEGSETFRIWLINPSGVSLGSPFTTTVQILDNEAMDGPNPIDNTNFFVRQQYIDFLGREPDPPGFAAWVGIINGCAQGDTSCDRIHVSQNFFQSEEFQTRGYFIYRFYPVSFPNVSGSDPPGYGHKPDYAQFVPDLARVSGFLDANQLEAAKVAFIADFMSRPAWVARYGSLGNTQYVDTLLNTANVTVSASARQGWIDGLNNSTLTRAAVLRQIAESPEVYNKYYNPAFAIMEYFGYLRRDPDAAYLTWIQVLNQTNDSRGMITGFVNSNEYKHRFGP